VTGLSLIL